MAVRKNARALSFSLGALLFCAVSFRQADLLGREFRDVGLLAKKAIALRFRDDDDRECLEVGLVSRVLISAAPA